MKNPTTKKKWDRFLNTLDIYGGQFKEYFYYEVDGQKVKFNKATNDALLSIMLEQI